MLSLEETEQSDSLKDVCYACILAEHGLYGCGHLLPIEYLLC